MKIRGYYLLLILIFGCSTTMQKEDETRSVWSVLKTKGLAKEDYEIQKMIFINEKDGLLFGSNYQYEDVVNNTVSQNQNAAISISKNGGGTWETTYLGKGVFFESQVINSKLIRSYKKSFKGKGLGEFESITAFDSKDNGKTWETSFVTKTEFLSILFIDSLNGIGISPIKNEIHRKLYITNDGGKKWMELDAGKYYFNNSIQAKGSKFYILASNENLKYNYNLIMEIDVKAKKFNVRQLEIGSVNHIYIDSAKHLWVIKDGERKIEVFLETNGKFDLFKKIDSQNEIFFEQIYSFDKVVSIIFSETISNQSLFNFIRSDNFGKNWENEKLPLNLMSTPSSFYRGNFVWLYAGGNRIQIRN